MQNSIEKNDIDSNQNINPKKIYLLLSKININEKPILKKYLTQYFESPHNFFQSNFSNKKIVLNKIKSQLEIFELPLPNRLIKKYKRRKSKGAAQMFNDTSIKDQIAEMASLYNSNSKEKKRIISEISEYRKDRVNKREISDQEIQYHLKAFETVRMINKNRINNFITKNEYIDMIHLNKIGTEDINNSANNKLKENETEKNIDIIENYKKDAIIQENNQKPTKSILSKSSGVLLKNKSDLEERILSSKTVKFQDIFKNNIINSNKTNKEKSMPKISEQRNKNSPKFVSIFDEISPPKTTFNKNEDFNSTLYSQYSTLYKTKYKTFRSKFKNTTNKFETIKGSELDDFILQKQSQYTLNMNPPIMQKELMKKLASQEKALNHNDEYNRKIKHLLKLMSKQLNIDKGKLMLGETDEYRIKKDIKIQLNDIMKKAYPENHFHWESELRNANKDNSTNEFSINNSNKFNQREIIRYPFKILNRSKSVRNLGEYDENYVKRSIPKTAFRKFNRSIKGIKGNFDGLLIKGQNLLKVEQDLIKKIKGKKILLNYNYSFNDKESRETRDTLFAYNIHINKYQKP